MRWRGTPTARWALAATVLVSGVAFLDSTMVAVALPALRQEWDTGLSGPSWVVNGSMVTLSTLILLSGSLSDRFCGVSVPPLRECPDSCAGHADGR